MEVRHLPAVFKSARPLVTVSVKKVIREMKLEKEGLWICVGKTNQGRFTGHFPGGDGMTQARSRMAKIPWSPDLLVSDQVRVCQGGCY